MSKEKKYIYSPNSVVLDMKRHPDAEIMLKIAKSVKGVRIEVVKNGQIATIYYPEAKKAPSFSSKMKSAKQFCSNWKTGFMKSSSGIHNDSKNTDTNSSDTRLYHAMILK